MANSGGAIALTEIIARILIDEVLEVPVKERGDPSVGFRSSDDDDDDEEDDLDQGQASQSLFP